MKTIHKYPLESAINVVKMNGGATVIACKNQNGTPTIWAIVQTLHSSVDRTFAVIMTGQSLPDNIKSYIDTVIIEDGIVLHVFELTP